MRYQEPRRKPGAAMSDKPITPSRQVAELQAQRDALRAQEDRYRRALDALYTISVACRGRITFREIFEIAYHELVALFPLDACYVAVCDINHIDKFRAAYMVDEGTVEYVEHIQHGHLTSRLLAGRVPLLFRDLQAERLQSSAPVDRFGNNQKLSRSWLGVPLLIGQDAVGVISVQSYAPNQYNETDLDLLQRFGNVVGVALENVGLALRQQELSQIVAASAAARSAELAVLSALAAEMVLQRPLPDFLGHALELLLPLFGLKAGNVRRYDAERNALVLLAQRGLPPDDARAVASVPVSNSNIGSIVRENRPIVIQSDLARYSLIRTPSRFQSLIGVPLRVGERVLGSLAVVDDQPRQFDAEQIDLLQVLGNLIALAIENTRLIQERERQIAELQALSRIGQAAATASDLPTLLHQVHAALQAFMQLDAFLILVYDPERQRISDGLGIDEGHDYTYLRDQPLPANSLSGWVVREQHKLHLTNIPEQIAHYPDLAEHIIGAERPAVSWLGVPLQDRDGGVIGLISIQSYTPDAFGPRDEQFLVDASRQVALHVQNMHLQNERERRIRELDALGQVGQLVSASYNLEEMLGQVYQHLLALTGASVFYFVVCEPETHIITHSAYIDRGERVPDTWVGRQPLEGSLTRWVLQNRRPLLLENLIEQRDHMLALGIAADRFNPDNNTRAWVGVPLIAKEGQPIGVISVQDYRPGQYNQHTVELLAQVASHLSLGIQKVRLFEERERQLAENARLFAAEQNARRTADTLREVARVISASFDASEVPHLILRELRHVIPYDTASILLIEGQHFRLAQENTPSASEPPTRLLFRVDELNAAALVVQRREPLLIGDTHATPTWSPIADRVPLRSWLGVPLIAKGQVLGVLNISAYAPDRFTERDAEVALAFGSQAAVAIENARLYQESVTRVEQELEIASQIQRNLFPRALPAVPGLELAAWCLPARETGGDFYDLIALRDAPDPLLGVVVGDASGKSIPAAMLMAVARSIARSEARDHQTPQEVMRETNRWIAHDIPPRAFVAMGYATLDVRSRRLALANAGQLAPLRRTAADGEIAYLEVPGNTLPLGIAPDTPYATLEVPLAAGDLLLFYTDGIVEAQNKERHLFGFERLEAIVRDCGDEAPREVIARIVAAVAAFSGRRPQHDDMTLVAIRIEG